VEPSALVPSYVPKTVKIAGGERLKGRFARRHSLLIEQVYFVLLHPFALLRRPRVVALRPIFISVSTVRDSWTTDYSYQATSLIVSAHSHDPRETLFLFCLCSWHCLAWTWPTRLSQLSQRKSTASTKGKIYFTVLISARGFR